VFTHPDPVAKDRSTGERTRGIDGNDGYRSADEVVLSEHRGHDGRLPNARGTRYPDDTGCATEAVESCKRIDEAVISLSNQRYDTGDRSLIARQSRIDKRIISHTATLDATAFLCPP